MDFFSDIIFLKPQLFYALFIIPPLIFLVYRTKKYGIDFKHTKDLAKAFGTNFSYLLTKISILVVMCIIFITLLADPNKVKIEKLEPKSWVDIEILLDISYSTLASDIEPNRIEAAKKVISEFADWVASDRLGLIVFAKKPFNVVPLTFDYKTFSEMASNVSVETINQWWWKLAWTNIWDSLISAYNSFTDDKREKVLILISDGSHNDRTAIDPIAWAKFLQEKWVKIHTIWLWKDEPSYVKEIWIIVDPVDEDWLKAIADIWWWSYFRADNSEKLSEIFDEIWELEKTAYSDDYKKIYTPYYLPFVFFLVVFFWIFLSLETLFNYRD